MSPADSYSNWDFTEVIDLINSPLEIATHPRDANAEDVYCASDKGDECWAEQTRILRVSAVNVASPKLGDFALVWDYLTKTPPLSLDQPISSTWPVPDRSISRTVKPDIPAKKYSILSHNKIDPALLKSCAAPVVSTLQAATSLKDQSGCSTTTESEGESEVFDSPIRKPSAFKFIPSQVKIPPNHSTLTTPPSSCDEVENAVDYVPLRYAVQETQFPLTRSVFKSSADRRACLMSKLYKRYPESFLRNQVHGPESVSSPKIHVFVDFSNIMIGFHDCVKLARSLPITTRLPRLPFSFYNLSLILERGRSVAKRVLAGSDRFPPINEAERIGYEVNILNRVHKTRYSTTRQMKHRNHMHGSSFQSSYFSDPDLTTSEGRWVEQAVDEILHLKMLESLIDSEEPATMVLATGDAAEAEYSGGFMKMVERALLKGWCVDLVSFDLNTSHAYKRKEFRSAWAYQFTMIHLDDYVEELLGD